MATTITAGGTTKTPALVLGYEAETESGNTIHRVIGSAEPAVTLGTEGLRTGTLNLFFLTETLAWEAAAFLKTVNVFTLASTEIAHANMRFVRRDNMTIALDTETYKYWLVNVPYQEVV